MDSSTEKRDGQKLVQSIVDLGNGAFNPDASPRSRAEAERDFDDLIQRTPTLALMSALNVLIRPSYTPPWLRTRLMEILTALPLRSDGVRGTMEFVFAVHPSSATSASDVAAPQKKGASITHEALSMASRLLSTPPASISPENWLSGVSPQLLQLLDGKEGADLAKVAAYVIGFGILGRKDLGAPGSPGWKWLAEPILCPLNPSIGIGKGSKKDLDPDEITSLGREGRTLISTADLARAIRRLRTLIISHPNPGLCKRLLYPILLPLWALSSWPRVQGPAEETLCQPAKELLQVYLKLVSSPHPFSAVVRNISYIGGDEKSGSRWSFAATSDGGVQIVSAPGDEPAGQESSLGDVDHKVTAFLDLLEGVASDADISSVFLDLFRSWIKARRDLDPQPESIVVTKAADEEETDPMKQLIEITLLQKMIDRFPTKLVSRSDHALELISRVLAETRSETGDESIPVALSILNLVLTAPKFQRAKVDSEVLHSLESALDRLAGGGDDDVAGTARNLALLLRYRDEAEELTGDGAGSSFGSADRRIEDRKTYSLAISYITQADSPPPVRSEGLHLLSTLVLARSAVLDIPSLLVLLSSLLSDNDDYINLRVIKIFTQLADHHPQSVANELIDHFVDAKETASLDARLRFGEALAQVVERLGETFAGALAQRTGEALLATAGRRGHRPKTEARQAREARAAKTRHREAEEAWEGQVPDLGEDISAEESERKELLTQIIEGWESKRGEEDVRVRASALSICATAMETNLGGLGSNIASSAVDLCVHILTLEPEIEKGILRRAAVLAVLSFVKALDRAREERRRLGFGLTPQSREDISRILNYVAGADNDGLVRQHAQDVIESLESWDMATLVPRDDGQGGATTLMQGQLAGLSVNPDPSGSSRPRIEEIE